MTTANGVTSVVFDLGGVLIDWNPDYLYRQLIPKEHDRKRFLTTVCTPEWNHRMDAGRPVSEAVAGLAAQYPDHEELIAAWWTRWPEMLGGEISATRVLAERLSEQGLRLFALTNWAAETWPHAVERFPFLGTLFEGVVVSGREGVAKPDPRIFDLLNDRYKVDPHHTVFIDDAPANIATATRLGYRAHHFTSTPLLEAWLVEEGLLDG